MSQGHGEALMSHYDKLGWDTHYSESVQGGELPVKYAHLLVAEEIIPTTPERLNGFTIYSPTANSGRTELAFAEELSRAAQGLELQLKPKVILADLACKHKINLRKLRRELHSTFPQVANEDENIDVVRIVAEAEDAPLKDHSVNVIWDRLGATWHYIFGDTPDSSPFEEAEIALPPLLETYKRLLKPDGCLIIDASIIKPIGAITSTLSASQGIRFADSPERTDERLKVDFNALGWQI